MPDIASLAEPARGDDQLRDHRADHRHERNDDGRDGELRQHGLRVGQRQRLPEQHLTVAPVRIERVDRVEEGDDAHDHVDDQGQARIDDHAAA